MMVHLLSIITFLPLIGVLIILVAPSTARPVALVTTLADFALSLVLWANFDGRWRASSQFVEVAPWLGHNITYHHGRRRHLDAVHRAGRRYRCRSASSRAGNRSRIAFPNT